MIKKFSQKAFTLIELMIVMAIICIVFALIIPQILDMKSKEITIEQTIDLNKHQDSGKNL